MYAPIPSHPELKFPKFADERTDERTDGKKVTYKVPFRINARELKIRLVKIAYEIQNLERFDFLFPCKKPIKFVDFAMSHPVLIRPYLLVVSPPLRIGEAVRSSFMLI